MVSTRSNTLIYLDNAATSWPKPRSVTRAVTDALFNYGANPGRSGHSLSLKAAGAVFSARETVCGFLDMDNAENIVFTAGCTHAVNLALRSVIKKGDHIIMSSLEHNATARPVHAMYEEGLIIYDIAVAGSDDDSIVEAFEALIRPDTSMIVCTHGSNVTGRLMPIQRISELCRRRSIMLLVDAAQTAGVVNISMKKIAPTFLCLAGHKGLYGPAGIGVLAIGQIPPGRRLRPLMHGGTGSSSASLASPDFLPDMLESGTLNTPGIMGLEAGIRFVASYTPDKIQKNELRLCQMLTEGLSQYENISIISCGQLPLVSFVVNGKPSEETAAQLDSFGVCARGGLHCAPLAHRQAGTLTTGAVRLCPSIHTTNEEIAEVLKFIKKIMKNFN